MNGKDGAPRFNLEVYTFHSMNGKNRVLAIDMGLESMLSIP